MFRYNNFLISTSEEDMLAKMKKYSLIYQIGDCFHKL